MFCYFLHGPVLWQLIFTNSRACSLSLTPYGGEAVAFKSFLRFISSSPSKSSSFFFLLPLSFFFLISLAESQIFYIIYQGDSNYFYIRSNLLLLRRRSKILELNVHCFLIFSPQRLIFGLTVRPANTQTTYCCKS